jgi:hypothetical protein
LEMGERSCLYQRRTYFVVKEEIGLALCWIVDVGNKGWRSCAVLTVRSV